MTFDEDYLDNTYVCEQLVRRGEHTSWLVVTGPPEWDARCVAAVEGAAATLLNNIGDVMHHRAGGGANASNLRSFWMFRC